MRQQPSALPSGMVLLILAALIVPSTMSPSSAQPDSGLPAPEGPSTHADFNGDGADDLAIGVPGQHVSGHMGAGAVNVIYGSVGTGLVSDGDQLWSQRGEEIQNRPKDGESFGAAVAVGDFNGDVFDDLAIGVPFDTGVGRPAGAVNILFGSNDGLTSAASLYLSQGVIGSQFGAALAAGDIDGDGYADLAVGVPSHGQFGLGGGAVDLYYGSPDGLSGGFQEWRQGFDGIAGESEDGDQLGTALTIGDFDGDGYLDLAAGAPGEDVSTEGETVIDAGAVNVIYGSAEGLTSVGNELLYQGTFSYHAEPDDAFGSALGAGDFEGDGFVDLVVGVPGESVGPKDGAGAVSVFLGSASGIDQFSLQEFWSLASPGVFGRARPGDAFGAAVAVGDFTGDGVADLSIGVPGRDRRNKKFEEDVRPDAGMVAWLHGSPTGLTPSGDHLLSQQEDAAFDGFGTSLGVGDFEADGFDDVCVGVPGEDMGEEVDAGSAIVFQGTEDGLEFGTHELWSQDSPGIEDESEEADLFASALP
jgi:hypothetical protein